MTPCCGATDAPLDAELSARLPGLSSRVHDDRPLVYLDSANTRRSRGRCSTAMDDFYAPQRNVARAMHALARRRRGVRGSRDGRALHRRRAEEVVFTKNASRRSTCGQRALGRRRTASARATRSSSPRWSTTPTTCRGQLLCERTGATLRWFGLTDEGRLDLDRSRTSITERTKVVSIVRVSNILGPRTTSPRGWADGPTRSGRS
jgi:cysteine desulfurase/selenocysteine lyase